MIKNFNKEFCKDPVWEIEGFKEALDDQEQVYVLHHIKGEKMSREQLIEAGQYYNVPATELRWVSKKEHQRIHHLKCKWHPQVVWMMKNVLNMKVEDIMEKLNINTNAYYRLLNEYQEGDKQTTEEIKDKIKLTTPAGEEIWFHDRVQCMNYMNISVVTYYQLLKGKEYKNNSKCRGYKIQEYKIKKQPIKKINDRLIKIELTTPEGKIMKFDSKAECCRFLNVTWPTFNLLLTNYKFSKGCKLYGYKAIIIK